MSKNWPVVKLGEVLTPVSRPVDVQSAGQYRQIGIRSHGKGVFHKEPVSGFDLGNKKVFWVEPGDFVLNIVFAWEGAVAIMSKAELGMIGSHRFPCFKADERRLDSRFLLSYFNTPSGLDLLGRISPGGAGRNRTLSRKAFLEQSIPLPTLSEQRWVVARIEELSAQIHEARRLRKEAVEEAEAMMRANCARLIASNSAVFETVENLVGLEGLRNGKSLKSHGADSQIHCLTLSAMRNGLVDLKESKPVPMSQDEALQFMVGVNDVFVVRGNGSKDLCGRAGVVLNDTGGCIFPDLFIRVSLPERKVLPRFFVAVWNSSLVRAYIEDKAKTTSGIWKINQTHILGAHIPVPPLPEQRRIVAELDALQAEVDALKRLQAETSAELDALLPSILDRAFQGKL